MALIMTDMRGALRSGLYATRSMQKPSAATTIIINGMDMYSGRLADVYTSTSPAAINKSP